MSEDLAGRLWQDRGIDPVTMEVVKNSLQSLVDEMAYTLGRTCASQLIREVQDFSTSLCDVHGDLVALSITQPGALGVIPGVMRNLLPVFAGSAEPGDVYIVNDPYHGGTHLNDIFVIKPVFSEGRPLAYLVTKAHHTDVGGKVPGSMSFDCSEIWQEGIRLPPLKLFERGEPNHTLFRLLELNVRYPDVLFADLNAQTTALEIGETGLLELAGQYGAGQLHAYFTALLDYGEAMARAKIRIWAEGSAEFEDYCDDDGVSSNPVVFHSKVTVKGDSVEIDFTGSSAQVPAAINFPPFEAAACGHLVIRCALGTDVPNNSGLFRSVTTVIPEGSILNPKMPGPCSERGLVVYRVGDSVFGAMANFVPEGVTAAGEGGSYLMRISGKDEAGHDFLCVDLIQGTWGARVAKDGIDGLSNLQANHTNTPVEVLEANFPLRVETHSLVADTGGAGKYRGGLSIERSWRYLGSAPGVFRSRSDRHRFPPYGLFGGESGAPSELWLDREGQERVQLHAKAVFELLPGDLVTLRIAGGGGWGPPQERDRQQILADLRAGKITPERARESYGAEAALTADAPARA